MSYGVKYTAELTDLLQREYEIKILEDGHGGGSSVELGAGDMIKMDMLSQGDPKYERIKATKSVASLIDNDGDFKFSDIFTSNSKKFILEIYRASSLIWKGYVLPETYQQAYNVPPVRVDIKAADGLALLQGVDHSFSGLTTGMDVITACQDEIGFALDIWDASYIYPDGADTSHSALHQVQFHADRWVKSNGDPFDLFEVLDAVLSSQACRILQAEGTWHIVPFELLGKEYTRTRYDSNGTKQEQTTFDPSVDAVKSANKEGVWTNNDATFKPDAAKKNIEVDNDIGAPGNLVTSGDFEYPDDFDHEVGNPIDITGWTDNGLSLGLTSTIGVEGLNDAITISPGSGFLQNEGSANWEVEDTELTPQSGDKLSINILYRFFGSAESGTLNFVIQVGNKWLKRVPGTPEDSYEWADSFEFFSWKAIKDQEYQNLSIETPEIPEAGDVRFAIYNFQRSTSVTATLSIAQWVVNYLPAGVTGTERFTTRIERDINANSDPVEYTLLHGDAPSTISPGALFFGGSLTSNWNRYEGGVSQSDDTELRKIIARVLAQMHQSPARRITGSLRGSHSWLNAITDQSKTLIPVGGNYDVRNATYTAEWVEFFTGTLAETIIDEESGESSSFKGKGIGEKGVVEELGLDSLGIGSITEDLDGSYTTIPVELDSPIRVGIDYWIVDEVDRELWSITPEDPDWDGNDLDDRVNTYGPGLLEGANELPIQEQVINAPEGSIIVIQPGQDDTASQFPEFDFVQDTLEIAERQLNATMDLIAQGVNFAKPNTTAVDNTTGDVLLSGTTGDLDDIDDGSSFKKVSSIAVTAGGIILMDQISGDLDDVSDGSNFQRVDTTQLTAGGLVILSVATGDLDDISDGGTYARVLATDISAGSILLAEAVGDLDDLSDGTNFQRVASTQLTAGGIVLLSVVSGDLDDVDDGTNFGKVNIINIDAGTGKITLVEAIGDIDDIADGSTYSKILATEVSAGHIKIVGADGQTVIDQGEIDTDAIFTESITVADTLTMGTGAEITNSTPDYSITEDGFRWATGTQTVRSLQWRDSLPSGTVRAQISASTDISATIVQSLNSWDLRLISNADLYLDAGSGGAFFILGLRTSNPGGAAGQLWNDSGTVKIT